MANVTKIRLNSYQRNDTSSTLKQKKIYDYLLPDRNKRLRSGVNYSNNPIKK